MSLATTVNLNATTPAPATGAQNIVFADDSGSPTVNISATDPVMVGDTGAGGTAGNVPAPPAGSAGAGKYLKADGTFAVPAGTGVGTFVDELITMTGTSGAFSHAPATLIGLFLNGQRLTKLGLSPDFSTVGTAITLTVAAVSGDLYEAVYWY
jgi:hypothetical protein